MTTSILLAVMQAFGGILIALACLLPPSDRKIRAIILIALGGSLVILGGGLREYEVYRSGEQHIDRIRELQKALDASNRTANELNQQMKELNERLDMFWISRLDEFSSRDKEPATAEPSATLGLPSDQLRILTLQDGDKVEWRQAVTGVIAEGANDLWVVVHPLETTEYWVQPKINVRAGGKWRVRVYLGRPGDIDVGKDFEVMAVAGSKQRLAEGMRLGDWPEARWRSEVVAVVRR